MKTKTYNINDIKGVDITSSPINVAPYRASHMVNMINDGGTNVKRHGWQGIATFELDGNKLPINGIYEYENQYVVHAGEKFYLCDKSFNERTQLNVTGATVTDSKSKGYVRDGKLWIVGAGDYLVYDGTKIQPVMNSEHAYIPTTSIGIKDAISTQSWEYQGESFQGVNLFNKRRINKLIGSEKTSSAYVLDGKIDSSQKVEINIVTDRVISNELKTLDPGDFKVESETPNLSRVLGNILTDDTVEEATQHYENLYVELRYPIMINSTGSLVIEGHNKFTITFHTESEPVIIDVVAYVLKDNEVVSNVDSFDYTERVLNKTITGITISNTEYVSKLRINGYQLFRGDINIKRVFNSESGNSLVVKEGKNEVLSYDYKTAFEGDGNIGNIIVGGGDIKLSEENGLGLVELGFSCPPILEGDSNISIEYTADYESDITISSSQEVSLSAGTDVLCLINNNNIVYFSDFLYGYGYFPDNDYIGLGKEYEPVTSITALDRGIGVFKANELYIVNLGINIIDKDYVVTIEPSVQGYYQGVGCENEFLGLNVNGDTLIYNSAGVHGVISSSTKITNMRSTNVNKALCAYTKEQRGQAFAVSHQGRYYLFIDGMVYIADTRYKYYESNRLDSGYEYEWWIWDNCQCRCAYSFDDKLYMGTDNGEIRAFGQGYKDVITTNLEINSQQLLYDGETFTLDSELYVEDGERIQINGAYEKLNLDDISRYYNRFDSDACTLYFSQEDFLRLYPTVISEGAEITLFDETYGTLRCTVVTVDTVEYSVYVEFADGTYNDSASYCLVKQADEYKAMSMGDDKYVLVDALGEKVTFVNYGDISAILDLDRPVMCEFRTGVIDFGSLHAKTLYRLCFTPTRKTSGKISLGYVTNLSDVKKQREFANAFDFLDYDFNKFTFDGGFFKTYIKRVFERNFNYIMFEFASIDEGPFGIENAQAVYSINNELRSDR